MFNRFFSIMCIAMMCLTPTLSYQSEGPPDQGSNAGITNFNPLSKNSKGINCCGVLFPENLKKQFEDCLTTGRGITKVALFAGLGLFLFYTGLLDGIKVADTEISGIASGLFGLGGTLLGFKDIANGAILCLVELGWACNQCCQAKKYKADDEIDPDEMV